MLERHIDIPWGEGKKEEVPIKIKEILDFGAARMEELQLQERVSGLDTFPNSKKALGYFIDHSGDSTQDEKDHLALAE